MSSQKEDQKPSLHHLLLGPNASQHHSPQLSPVQPISLATSSSSNGRSDSDEPRGLIENTSPSPRHHRPVNTKLTSTPLHHPANNISYTAQQAAVAIEFARQNQVGASDQTAATNAAMLFHPNHNSHNISHNNINNNNNVSTAVVNLKVMRSSGGSSPVPTDNGPAPTAGGGGASSYRSSSDTPQTPPSGDRREMNLTNMNGEFDGLCNTLILFYTVYTLYIKQTMLSFNYGRAYFPHNQRNFECIYTHRKMCLAYLRKEVGAKNEPIPPIPI